MWPLEDHGLDKVYVTHFIFVENKTLDNNVDTFNYMLLVLYNHSCPNMHFHHIFKEKKKYNPFVLIFNSSLMWESVIIRSILENDCSILEEKLDK